MKSLFILLISLLQLTNIYCQKNWNAITAGFHKIGDISFSQRYQIDYKKALKNNLIATGKIFYSKGFIKNSLVWHLNSGELVLRNSHNWSSGFETQIGYSFLNKKNFDLNINTGLIAGKYLVEEYRVVANISNQQKVVQVNKPSIFGGITGGLDMNIHLNKMLINLNFGTISADSGPSNFYFGIQLGYKWNKN